MPLQSGPRWRIFCAIFSALLLSSGVWDFMLKIPAIPHMVVVVLEIDIEMILITFGETFPPVKGNILFLRMELPVSCLETAGFSL